jgi:hypothetical protein
MPGTSTRTRPAAVRLTALGHAVIEALAEKYSCSRSEAHKRALIAGSQELLGASKWRELNRKYETTKGGLPPTKRSKDMAKIREALVAALELIDEAAK